LCYGAGMADGALNISLDGPLADDVRAAAAARGQTPEDYVRAQLAEGLAADDYDDLSLAADMRRLAEPGEDIDAKIVFAELREQIASARRSK